MRAVLFLAAFALLTGKDGDSHSMCKANCPACGSVDACCRNVVHADPENDQDSYHLCGFCKNRWKA